MILLIENVKTEFLADFENVAQKAGARVKFLTETPPPKNKSEIIQNVLEDFKKPENYAVFERLKDK